MVWTESKIIENKVSCSVKDFNACPSKYQAAIVLVRGPAVKFPKVTESGSVTQLLVSQRMFGVRLVGQLQSFIVGPSSLMSFGIDRYQKKQS